MTARRLKRYAEENREENSRFKSYLSRNVRVFRDIDTALPAYYAEARTLVDCTECAACCRIFYPMVTDEDVVRLAAYLGMSVARFDAQYLMERDDGETIIWRKPCPFLKRKRCSVYEARPDACRVYPNLLEESFVLKLPRVIIHAEHCPLLYMVLEHVKDTFWRA